MKTGLKQPCGLMFQQKQLQFKNIEMYQQNKFLNEKQNMGYDMQQNKRKKAGRYLNEVRNNKLKIKELYTNLTKFIKPQRQRVLCNLVQSHLRIQNIQQNIRIEKYKNIQVENNCIRLKEQKQRQQKMLQDLMQKKIDILMRLQNDNKCKVKLQQKNNQLVNKKVQLQRKINQIKKIYQKDTQQYKNNSLFKQINDNNYQNSFNCQLLQQQNKNNLINNDLQLRTLVSFVQNAKIHGQQLKDCLSSRLRYLIQIQESKRVKQLRVKQVEEQNNELKGRMEQLCMKIDRLKCRGQQQKRQLEDEQIGYVSILNENIQLKARLSILEHELSDQQRQQQRNIDKIQYSEQLIYNGSQSLKQTQCYYQKLIKIKLQSQYLQSRAQSFINNSNL